MKSYIKGITAFAAAMAAMGIAAFAATAELSDAEVRVSSKMET